jgi:hypothetical protein
MAKKATNKLKKGTKIQPTKNLESFYKRGGR